MSKRLVDIGTQTTAKLIDNKIGHAIGISTTPKESEVSEGYTMRVGAINIGNGISHVDGTIALNFKEELYMLPNNTKNLLRMTEDMRCWDDNAISLPYNIETHETRLLVYDNPITKKTEIHMLGGHGYKRRTHYKWDGNNWSVASELPYDFCGGKAIVYNDEIHIFGGGPAHYSPSPSTTKEETLENIKVYTVGEDVYAGDVITLNAMMSSATINKTDKTGEIIDLKGTKKEITINSDIESIGVNPGTTVTIKSNSYLNYHFKWNGSNWEEASNPSFNMRGATPVVFDNSIWMIGGANPDNFRKVHSFSNGSWGEQTDLPESLNYLSDASIAVYDNKIHVTGGNSLTNNVVGMAYTHMTYSTQIGWRNASQIPYDTIGNSSNGMVVYKEKLWLAGYVPHYLTLNGSWLAYQDIEYSVDKGIIVSLDSINGEKMVYFEGKNITPIEPLTGVEIDMVLPFYVSTTDTIIVKSPTGDIHVISKENHYRYIKSIQNDNVVYTLSTKIDKLPISIGNNASAGFYNNNLHVVDQDVYNVQYVLDDNGWTEFIVDTDIVKKSKLITVGEHLYGVIIEPTSDSNTTVKIVEFDGNSWELKSNSYNLDTHEVMSMSLVSFQSKLHIIFLDEYRGIRHIVYSGSRFIEYEYINSAARSDIVKVVVRNNYIHVFDNDINVTHQYCVAYALRGEKEIQVYLPKGHQIICNKNEIVPIYGYVEETSSGYRSTDSGFYHFLVASEEFPIYSIV